MPCQVRGSPHISKIYDVPEKRKEAQTFWDLSADWCSWEDSDWLGLCCQSFWWLGPDFSQVCPQEEKIWCWCWEEAVLKDDCHHQDLTTPDWLWISYVRRFLVSLWSAGRGSAVQLSTRLLFQRVWPRRSLCSFQFNKLHHFDCLCSSINYSAKYCPFLKKSGSFEILLLCTTKFWHYFLKLTKFKSFYEGFTFSASYRGRTCISVYILCY